MKCPTIKRYLTAIRRANYPMTCGDFAKMVRKAEELHYGGDEMRELIESYITADSDMTKLACTFMLALEHGWMFELETEK